MITAPIQIIPTGDGSHTLFNPSLDETYHSRHGAIAESKHVFIEHGLKALPKKTGPIRILEIGLGTGLNAFLTALVAEKMQLQVSYTALETFPVPLKITDQLNYPDILGGQELFDAIHRAEWGIPVPVGSHFSLTKNRLSIDDYVPLQNSFDLIYFDAFAPGKQPEIWEKTVLEKMHTTLDANGILVTYCAQGQFRRDLISCGFVVEELEGPPGKWEMTRGEKTVSSEQ